MKLELNKIIEKDIYGSRACESECGQVNTDFIISTQSITRDKRTVHHDTGSARS